MGDEEELKRGMRINNQGDKRTVMTILKVKEYFQKGAREKLC